MTRNALLIVVFALLVGAVFGFLAERQRATGKMESAKMGFQKQIDSAKMANDKLMKENKEVKMKLTPTPSASPSETMKK